LEHDEQMDLDDRAELSRLERMQRTPYFGRVDFLDKFGETEVYVGIATLEGEEDFLVYDWRSPVASLYYKGGTVKAAYDAPVGCIEGEITLKRQYTIENGGLGYYFDTDVEISDGILKEALAKPGGQKLKVIVTTIQTLQNEAIRKPWRKNLLVTGPAGCGKTSVGMHRLAWMLYENRGRLKAEDITIFTQSNLFRDYIIGVLPALGEKETGRLSLEELLEEACPGLEVEDLPAFTDRMLCHPEDRTLVREKLSQTFRESLSALTEEEVRLPELSLFGEVILSAGEAERRYREDQAYPPKVRGRRLCDYAEELVNSWFDEGEKREDKPVRTLLTLHAEEAGYMPLDEVIALYRMRLPARFREGVLAALPHDVKSLYGSILRGRDKSRFFSEASEGKIRFEDALGMATLRLILEGADAVRSPKHILIDEAQDYPAMAHELIRGLFPNAVFTLLADRHQGLLEGISSTEEDFMRIYDPESVRFARSFRATRQIATYALTLTDDRYEIFSREGDEVEFSEKCGLEGFKKALSERKDGETCAIITRDAGQAQRLYETLGAEADLVISRETCMRKKLLIAPVVFTKGLEFDRVILDRSLFQDDRRALYLAATRALHHLCVIE